MSKAPSVSTWMPVFLKDHKAEASTLTHIQHSALVYFRMMLWESGGSVLDDDKAIAAELRLTVKQWRDMRPRIIRDCTISGGRISHPDVEVELDKARNNIAQKQRAGKASADARKAQREGNGRSTGVATDVQPYAGGGVGVGYNPSHYQEEETLGQSHTRETGLTVIRGGGK